MDCTNLQTQFLQDLEAQINTTTPQVRYECQADRVLFAIPTLIRKIGVMKEGRVYLCDEQGKCLTPGSTAEESVKLFKEFVDSLLYKKRT